MKQVTAARTRVALAEKAIDVAEDNVRAERASFMAGRTTNFQVMQRQTSSSRRACVAAAPSPTTTRPSRSCSSSAASSSSSTASTSARTGAESMRPRFTSCGPPPPRRVHATRGIHIVNRTARSVLKGSTCAPPPRYCFALLSPRARRSATARRLLRLGPDAGDASAARVRRPRYRHRRLRSPARRASPTCRPACWELNGKLTLRGPAVTSLDKLGDLRTRRRPRARLDRAHRASTRPRSIDVTGDIDDPPQREARRHRERPGARRAYDR